MQCVMLGTQHPVGSYHDESVMPGLHQHVDAVQSVMPGTPRPVGSYHDESVMPGLHQHVDAVQSVMPGTPRPISDCRRSITPRSRQPLSTMQSVTPGLQQHVGRYQESVMPHLGQPRSTVQSVGVSALSRAPSTTPPAAQPSASVSGQYEWSVLSTVLLNGPLLPAKFYFDRCYVSSL